MRVGDIDVTRDFTDVRDIVLAYKALVANGESGETYNVCSGQEFAIREILARLIDIAGVKVTVEPDPASMRPVQQRRQVVAIPSYAEQLAGSHQFKLTKASRKFLPIGRKY